MSRLFSPKENLLLIEHHQLHIIIHHNDTGKLFALNVGLMSCMFCLERGPASIKDMLKIEEIDHIFTLKVNCKIQLKNIIN